MTKRQRNEIETDLLRSLEAGEWKSVHNLAEEIVKYTSWAYRNKIY
jgi:hypothetical protein